MGPRVPHGAQAPLERWARLLSSEGIEGRPSGHSGDGLTGLSATKLAELIRGRAVSATEVVSAHLERCSEDPCNAIVARLDESALADARRADARKPEGPLHGVPFTVKDAIAVGDQRTCCGSRLLRENVTTSDAPAVAGLRAAGAILIARTNCPEFAFGPRTENDLFGRTVNPCDPGLVPGGSSGGCAAAVATGCAPLSLGTDYGGSLRWPPHCCGVSGMRPSPGVVPTEGQVPAAPAGPRRELSLIGPIARNVGDLRLALEAIGARLDASTPARCMWTPSDGSFAVRDDVAAVVERAANALARAGLQVEERRPHGLDEAEALYSRWRATDDLADLRELGAGREEQFTGYIRWLLATASEAKSDPSVADDAAALASRVGDQLTDSVLLLPVALTPAIPHEASEVEVAGRRIDVNGMKLLAPCRAISVLRLPAVAVPAGLSDDGLPIGVQLVGQRGTDGMVLAAAEVIERELTH